MDVGSKEVSRCAMHLALSESRAVEMELKQAYLKNDIKAAAVDFGGEYLKVINKIVEQAIVAGKREGLIRAIHHEEGTIAGATRDALAQIQGKAVGMSIGGKLGLARRGDHLSIAVFVSIGMLYLNETAVGLAHRTIG